MKNKEKTSCNQSSDDISEPLPKFTKKYAQDIINQMLVDGIRPTQKIATEIFERAYDIFCRLPNIVEINNFKNIIIVGDVHGQFHDVAAIFKEHGFPSEENPYLFNGDFVDRGKQGIEILISLFAFKIACPKAIYMNRGNHEIGILNKYYGFHEECLQKYDSEFYELTENIFKSLPLAHVINHSIFIVHGGLCRDQSLTLAGLQQINRFVDPPPTSTVHDLLWSDPMNGTGFKASARCDNGQTVFFGVDVTEKFLKNNGLKLLVRSHEVQDAGFAITQNGKCVTVFSAPNYMGQIGNKGAIIKYVFDENGEIKSNKIVQFDSVQPW